MRVNNLHRVLNIIIATIWLVNGLVCKVLNLVPRHEQIVGQILGSTYSRMLTMAIGISEIVMAIWVISKFKSRINAITQISIVAVMNLLEFILVPELLLWGKLNSFFALLFIGVVYYYEFILKKELR
ncbi:DoxX-like family protein [Maribacter sp. R77961]|uniref:DoxX-like family protein n=1 Tax=Maribacter sp. R77961 TaxID=3093871 RepID=UPI0037CCBA86